MCVCAQEHLKIEDVEETESHILLTESIVANNKNLLLLILFLLINCK